MSPMGDVNVEELLHASMVDDITNAVTNRLSDSITTEISTDVQKLGLSSGGILSLLNRHPVLLRHHYRQ